MRIVSELKKEILTSKSREVMKFYDFIFKAWKVMECEYGSWKGMEMTKVIFP